MAQVIKVSDLVVPKSPTNSITQVQNVLTLVNTILNSPIINGLVMKYVGMFSGSGSSLNRPRQINPQNKSEPAILDPNKIYSMLLGSIQKLIDVGQGDMTLKQLEQFVIKEETQVKGMVSDAIGNSR